MTSRNKKTGHHKTGHSAKSVSHKPVVRWKLSKPVYFVGFMGSGKSTAARRLARRYHIPSVDLDVLIERREKKKIKQIFAEGGEEVFRDKEAEILKEVSQGEPVFVSCGGGIIKRPENREILKRTGFVVYLKVEAAEAARRISDLSTRPLFSDLDTAQKTNEERIPQYRKAAHVTIDTAGMNSGQTMAAVQRVLKREGILWQPQK